MCDRLSSSNDFTFHLSDDGSHYDEYMKNIQLSYTNMSTTLVYDSIDTNNLDLSRNVENEEFIAGPGTKEDVKDEKMISNMKIASLEAFGDLNESNDYVQLFQSVLGEQTSSIERRKRVNESLINYFALLGATHQINTIDILFVESLIKVADVSTRDVHGQSIMHEIAREWSTDIAKLLLLKGMNIDLEDNWGRTPLFVAVASNHVKMIKWLIENGADINHRTIEGEGQCPIHFAAKHNSVQAFHTLMDNGADPLIRDDKNKTPFFVAAHAGHQKMCQYMLDLDLPVVSYSSVGEATIDHIVDRLPNSMANAALTQFIAPSQTPGRWKMYLSCFGKKRWKILSQHDLHPTACKVVPPGPLEIILDRQDVDLIMHPAILRFLKLKSSYFATKYINASIFFHCLFTLMWTLAVTLYKETEEGYSSTGVLILTVISQVLTIAFMYKFYRQNEGDYNSKINEKERKMRECFVKKKFCHPRWRLDSLNLERDIEAASTIEYSIFKDLWNVVEILCLLMATVHTILTFTYIGFCDMICVQQKGTAFNRSEQLRNARLYFSAVFILVVWIRLNSCLRHHQQFAPFVAMLEGSVGSLIKIGFLFFEFFIPFCVACWVLFGGQSIDPKNKTEYESFSDMIYQVYLLTIVGDYDYDPLVVVHRLAAQLFVGVYALVVSIITINLYIGLLSEAYSSISATANAKAYLHEAMYVRRIERFAPEEKLKFETYLNKYCAPMIVSDYKDFRTKGSARVIIKDSIVSVKNISNQMTQINKEQENFKKDIISLNKKVVSDTPSSQGLIFNQLNDKNVKDDLLFLYCHSNALRNNGCVGK